MSWRNRLFCDANQCEECCCCDGLNNESYSIVLKVPVALFKELQQSKKTEEAEKMLLECYHNAMRGGESNLWMDAVSIRPSADETVTIGEETDDSCWKPN